MTCARRPIEQDAAAALHAGSKEVRVTQRQLHCVQDLALDLFSHAPKRKS
jgi:hypothetical protein